MEVKSALPRAINCACDSIHLVVRFVFARLSGLSSARNREKAGSIYSVCASERSSSISNSQPLSHFLTWIQEPMELLAFALESNASPTKKTAM